jgi:hypothetical protein
MLVGEAGLVEKFLYREKGKRKVTTEKISDWVTLQWWQNEVETCDKLGLLGIHSEFSEIAQYTK